MVMDCTTSWVMSRNGVKIGMIAIKIAKYYEVVPGVTLLTTFASCVAITVAQQVEPSAVGFDACQDRLNYL